MALFSAKRDDSGDPDAKPSKASVKAESRVVFVIGGPDSECPLISNTIHLLGIPEFEKVEAIEKLNYDILKTLKLDYTVMHLMPENWEKNDLLEPIQEEIKAFAKENLKGKGTFVINSCHLSRTAGFWANIFKESGIEVNFVISFSRPTDNYLQWLVFNLEAEKNSRGFPRSFIHLPDLYKNWRKSIRKTSNELDLEFSNWLSTTRENEVDSLVSAKNITVLPHEKRQTPINVKRLYSALRDAANGKKYDETVTEEVLPDIKLFFAPIIQKNTEIHQLRNRLARIEVEVVDLRDRLLQPDDDMYEQALDDGTIDKARAAGEKLYLQSWRSWAQERKAKQDFRQYPLFSEGAPLADEVADIAKSFSYSPIVIVDVMSPPVTSVGTDFNGRPVQVIPITPYANEFNLALQQAGIRPPVPVIKAEAEQLVKTFGPKTIDIVHCREAIEFTKNPVMVIMEMLGIMKDNGAVFLSHQVNKASEENFNTLAQWNCVEKGGQFIIWNSWYKFNISRMLAGAYDVEAKSYFDFVEVVIRRKK